VTRVAVALQLPVHVPAIESRSGEIKNDGIRRLKIDMTLGIHAVFHCNDGVPGRNKRPTVKRSQGGVVFDHKDCASTWWEHGQILRAFLPA
jgi:hypothetical protein